MKRILTIPLLIVYIIAVSGVMIQLHYCGQELESWNLFAENDGCMDGACSDDNKANDGCCKDEVVIAKVNQEQNIAHQLVLKFMTADYTPALPSFMLPQAVTLHIQQATVSYSSNAPPGLWQNIPLYKLHTHYTYYG